MPSIAFPTSIITTELSTKVFLKESHLWKTQMAYFEKYRVGMLSIPWDINQMTHRYKIMKCKQRERER